MSTQMGGGFPFVPGAGAGSGQIAMGGGGGTMYGQEGGGWQGAAQYGGNQWIQPGVGGQQGMHPTVQWGQGIPQGGGQQGWNGPPGWNDQPNQGGGWGYQGQQGQRQQGQSGSAGGWGGQPAFNPRMVQLTPDTILDGPGVPDHLRGRTFGFLTQLYNGLSTHYAQTRGQGGQDGGQQQQGQGWGQQPGGGQQGQGQAGGQPSSMGTANFLSNPTEAIRAVLREEMQPIQGATMASRIQDTWRQAPQMIPDYPLLEAGIVARVSQLSPELRGDPQAWLNAADMARGEAIRTGEYQRFLQMSQQQRNGRGQQQGNGQQGGWGGQSNSQMGYSQGQPQIAFAGAQGPNGGWAGAQGYPFMPVAPSAMQPMMGMGQAGGFGFGGIPFFTETSSSPWMHELSTGVLTPAQREAARGFGMSEEQYMAWMPNRG